MQLEPLAPPRLAARRSALGARIDAIESDVAALGCASLPPAVRALLDDLDAELGEVDRACLGDDAGDAAIVRQHGTLRRDLDAIARHFDAMDAGLPRPPGWSDGPAAYVLLADLHRQVCAHMAFEERHFEELAERAPHRAARAEILLGDHDALRDALEGLVRAARAAEFASEWVRIEAEFAALRRALLAHEEAETRLVQSAVLEDLGGGD